MSRKTLDNLGHLQQAIMLSVWELGEATVQQVYDQLNQDKPLQYMSILSVMRRLEKAGWLEHRTEGRTFIFRATSSHEEEAGRSLNDIQKRLFGGNSRLMMQCLLDSQSLDEEDLKVLSKMINAKRKGKSHDRGSS